MNYILGYIFMWSVSVFPQLSRLSPVACFDSKIILKLLVLSISVEETFIVQGSFLKLKTLQIYFILSD